MTEETTTETTSEEPKKKYKKSAAWYAAMEARRGKTRAEIKTNFLKGKKRKDYWNGPRVEDNASPFQQVFRKMIREEIGNVINVRAEVESVLAELLGGK